MPIDPRMVVDTNSIPAGAIQRVEVISGGASAVYGADAVGGVVNFILKDNYEGANIDVRFGDTEHGGDQTTQISALFGANVADDRGNVMLGIERDTRSKQLKHQRDWRIEDLANPATAGGGFAFGSATWFHNEPGGDTPNPNFQADEAPGVFNPKFLPNNTIPNPAFNPALPAGATNNTTVNNNPTQAAVNALFPPATSACPFPQPLDTGAADGNPATPALTPGTTDDNPATLCLISNSLATGRFRINRDGTVFSGLADASSLAPGAYKFKGPVFNDNYNGRQGTGDLDGSFQGLPVFVMQPNGAIKENVLYNWASTPLERLSAFANGHFDVAENLRVTGQAMVTRTKTESSLGLTAANINQWGAGVPFGNQLFRGYNNTYTEVPDSLIDTNGDGVVDSTNPAYTLNGRFGVNCDAPVGTPGMPWAAGQPGCTNSEAWPTSPEVYNLMMTRVNPNATLWASREPDWMRNALGVGRSTTNETTTMSFTLGLEGDLPSGDHSWDVSLYTGRS